MKLARQVERCLAQNLIQGDIILLMPERAFLKEENIPMKESINRAREQLKIEEENAKKIEIFFEKIKKEQPQAGAILVQIFENNTLPSSRCSMGNRVTGLFIEDETINLQLIKMYDNCFLEAIPPKTKNSNRE